MSEDWQRPEFRQNVVAKINEAVAATSLATSKNGTEMESHVYSKARTKEEYLGYVAKLIFHVRDSKLKSQQQLQQQQQQQQQHNSDNSGNNSNGMQDPINALQNLASHQGNRGPMPPQMMSMGGQLNNMGNIGGPGGAGGQPGGNANVLQSLIHQRPGLQQMPNMSNISSARLGPGNNGGQQLPGVGNMQQGVGQMATGGGMVGGQMGMGPMSGGGQVGQGPNSGQMGGGMQMGGLVVGNAQMANQPMNNMNNMGMINMPQNQSLNVGGMNPQQMVNQNQISQLLGRINVPGGGNINQQQQQQMQMNQMNPGQQMNPNSGGMSGGIVGQQQQQQQPQQMSGGTNVMVGQMPQQQQLNANQMGGTGNQMNLNQMLSMQQQQQQSQHMVRKPDMMLNANVPFPQQGGLVRPNMPNAQQQQQQQQPQQQQPGQQQQYNFRKSPSPSAPSPAGMSQPPSHLGQMVPSPALAPSPQMLNQQQPHRNVMAPSPNASLNTPGQANNAVPSPLNALDEQQYREKYRQLTKYIEPLKRMIARIEKDGKDSTEKLLKMNKLLELLCNPSQRVPLETLLKCEMALERLDFKNNYFVAPGSQLGGASKEHPINNILLEAVNANLQTPIGNHTLQRTFRPCLEALFGPEIKNMPPPIKRRRISDDDETATPNALVVPHVLQGEIARLDQKFKVQLDPSTMPTGKGVIKLVCQLDDRHLPCVPPISVVIPEGYPMMSPNCKLIEYEYNSTPFLTSVQSALAARVSKLPKLFSLTHLLDTWEMAVRMACSPNRVQPSTTTVLMGV